MKKIITAIVTILLAGTCYGYSFTNGLIRTCSFEEMSQVHLDRMISNMMQTTLTSGILIDPQTIRVEYLGEEMMGTVKRHAFRVSMVSKDKTKTRLELVTGGAPGSNGRLLTSEHQQEVQFDRLGNYIGTICKMSTASVYLKNVDTNKLGRQIDSRDTFAIVEDN